MNSTSTFNMYYKSIPNIPYYACGRWIESDKYNKKQGFLISGKGTDNEQLIYTGQSKKSSDACMTFFRPDPTKCPDPHLRPLSIDDYFWQTAPIPKSLWERVLGITNNSGKFLVFTSVDKLEVLWDKFKEAYKDGKLGYGLQCATARNNPHANDQTDKVILVHTEDAFNMEEVARVAWEIDKIMEAWEGVLHYMTDRSVKAKTKLFADDDDEGGKLYSISSRSFIINAKEGGTAKKTLPHFINTFRFCIGPFIRAAAVRQEILKHKNWRKFIEEQYKSSHNNFYSHISERDIEKKKNLSKLDLPHTADWNDVRTKFKEISKTRHPDKVDPHEREKATRYFADISTAYAELKTIYEME